MSEKIDTSDELLDIKQAARLLQVSEVSLRRWTDDGKLPCMRVGGRRERRFRRRDLEQFLDGQRDPSPGAIGDSLMTSCVELEDMRLRYGTHLCAFYESDAGRLKLAIPFLASGLRSGDACFMVAAPDAALAVTDSLCADEASALGASELAGLLVLDGTPDPFEMVDYFKAAFLREVARGKKCRVLGDMACFLGAGAQLSALLAFEAHYNQSLAHQFPVLSLCQYDCRIFSAAGVVGALRCHEDTFSYPLSRFLCV